MISGLHTDDGAGYEYARQKAVISRFLVVVLLVSLGCASNWDVRAREPLDLPDLMTLSPVERLGYEIYLRDQAAWKATDVALEAGLQETPAEGWISILTIDGWLVRFVGPCDAGVCSFIDVEVGATGPLPILTDGIELPLPDDQAARWRARQLAVRSDFRRCTERYNVVVVSAEFKNEPVWRVYLLASSSDSRDVVLTGHHRVTVSRDGGEILLAEPLSKSCVISQPPKNVSGMFVTHILHPEPIETHVFTSLDYRMPLFVGTETGKFEVAGPSIRRLSE